jgi:hypothetical protein
MFQRNEKLSIDVSMNLFLIVIVLGSAKSRMTEFYHDETAADGQLWANPFINLIGWGSPTGNLGN